MEFLPHPLVVHLLPFFKLFSSFLELCISQGTPLSDSQYWTVSTKIIYTLIYGPKDNS